MYKPLPKSVTIKVSDIDGLGLFSTETIEKDTDLGITHIILENIPNIDSNEIFRTPLAGFINHSDTPNCVKRKINSKYYLITLRKIKKNEELTLKYTLYNPKGNND